MDAGRKGTLLALLCLAATALSWGSIPIFLRYFTSYLDVWTTNGTRYAVGALFWLPSVMLLARRRERQGNPLPGRSVWRAALIPTPVNALAQTGYAISPYFLPAPTVAFVMRLSFLFTILFGFVFLAEERRLGRRPAFWAGVAVSLAGLAIMFCGALRARGGASLTGMAIAAASTVAWGAYAVSVRKCMAAYPARLGFGVISLYTAAILAGLMLLFGDLRPLAHLPRTVWACLVGSALIGIAFGHVFYYRAIHRLGPVISSGVLLVTPFITYLGAAAILGETLGWTQWAGGISIVAGGALLVKSIAHA